MNLADVAYKETMARIRKLEADRAELLAALEEMTRCFEPTGDKEFVSPLERAQALMRSRAEIDRAKEKK